MLRLQIRAGVLLLGALLFLRPSLIAAPQGPVAAMYADDQARGNAIPQGFVAASLPASGNASATAQIYLTTGDLQRAFDEARFRPGAAIVPTNTELQLSAKAPATQQVLVDRVRKQPDAMRALQEQVDARRSRAGGAPGQAVVLEVGVDTFVAKLSGSGSRPATGAFPATVCLVATDFPQGVRSTAANCSRRTGCARGSPAVSERSTAPACSRSPCHWWAPRARASRPATRSTKASAC